MRFARTVVAALVASTSLIAASPASPASAVTSELLISEYIEGSSNNKAIEIYNGTGAPVDLTGYSLQMFFNGNAAAGLTITLVGSVADGDVHVVAQSSANATILAQADQTSGAGWFNGDDAVVLRKGGVVVDSIGQVGFDPGTEWGAGLVSTADNTLRRKASVCAGDTVIGDVFDPAAEWDGFAQDTFNGLGAHTADCGGPATPVINEFSASTAGADVEYVEVKASPGTDLSAYTVLEIEGDAGAAAGTVDEVIQLGTTDASGYFLVNLPANSLENGTITLLLVDGFTGALNQDLDTNNDGTLDITPWSAVVDGVAVNDGGAGDVTYAVTLGVAYDGLPFAPGGASRIPDGTDNDTAADWVRNDFDLAGIPGFPGTPIVGEALNTPGAPNLLFVPPPGGVCGDPTVRIHQIQGSGDTFDPDFGGVQSVEAVVTALTPGLGGLYVQEEPVDQDFDATTSEGIFVFLGGALPPGVGVGDVVRVTGTVGEFVSSGGASSQTQLTASPIVTPCGSTGVVPPTDVVFPLVDPGDLEAFEGMLVALPQDLVISEYFNFDRFGEVVVSLPPDGWDRLVTPTAVVEPGSEAIALAAEYAKRRITLDDGRSSQNPDPAIHPGNGLEFTLDNSFRGGDVVTGTVGVVDHTFGLYRVQPTVYGTYTPRNPRTAAPDDVGGNLQVASFNVLNYFTTLGSRGAGDAEEFTRQRDKIIAAITALDADVVGLIEIENNTAAIADLVAGLNEESGAGTYQYVDTGVIGTDAIKVAFIYQPAAATPVGNFAILDSSVDARFIDTKNRPVLAQTFMNVENGGLVTVAVNHLKSKGSDCNDVGDPDLGDGAANCNITRTLAAEALVDWLATDPTGVEAPALIIGDLNSYDKEDPIDVLVAAGYTDLVALYEGEYAYSYVFDGQVGYLDHALADADLLPDVTGTTVWHINADEPDLIDYDTTFKLPAQDAIYAPDPYRSSDHDPVLVGLDVCDAIAPSLDVTLDTTLLWPPNHQMVTVTATVVASDNFDADVTAELVSVTSNEPDDGLGDGDTIGDIVIIDDTTFELRAERSAVGSGRVYTVTYSVTDSCGNTTLASDTVLVPLSMARHGR